MADPRTFRCELIGPAGKLLDGPTTSVVFPAHDGLVGILHDHMPMLSQLGLGLLKVVQPPAGRTGDEPQPDLRFFVDGGFALVAENSVTLIAYDALALQNVKADAIESLLEKAARNLASPTLSYTQRTHERERWRVLQKIADSIRT